VVTNVTSQTNELPESYYVENEWGLNYGRPVEKSGENWSTKLDLRVF